MSAAALRLCGLVGGHGSTPVVHGLDLAVEPGSVVGLLGPNGAGKTTVLDTVMGLLPPLGGAVELFGRPMTGAAPQQLARADVAYVPERRGLFGALTVAENMRLRTRSRHAAHAALRTFPALEPLAERRTSLLSGGEQQLLALACALARRPRLLLIDEMTMGLAPIVIEQLVEIVRGAAREGVAVLFVEQHVHVVLELADEAYLLRRGRCVLHAPRDQLANRLTQVHASYVDPFPNTAGHSNQKEPA